MRVVIAGGTGFIGKALVRSLSEAGHWVDLLTRDPIAQGTWTPKEVLCLPWDGETLGSWAQRFEDADAVINLVGEPIVGKRWTLVQKEKLRTSRLASTKVIVTALRKAAKKPSVLINASAIGYYGHVAEGDVTEEAAKGAGFLADLCLDWEQEAMAASELGVRVVCLRIGVVLEQGGGAIQKMMLPFRLFAGGPLGSGKQWFPWIHREDLVHIITFILENPELSGPVNATAPDPVRMTDFCKAFGKALGRPSWAPVPSLALKLLMGEMADMLLTGQRVVPRKLQGAGYPFKYPAIGPALEAVVGADK